MAEMKLIKGKEWRDVYMFWYSKMVSFFVIN